MALRMELQRKHMNKLRITRNNKMRHRGRGRGQRNKKHTWKSLILIILKEHSDECWVLAQWANDETGWDETRQPKRESQSKQERVREQRQQKDSIWELRIMVILSGIFRSWAPQHRRNNWMNDRACSRELVREAELKRQRKTDTHTHIHSDKNFQSDFWCVCVRARSYTDVHT